MRYTHTKPCDRCAGTGLIVRDKRHTADGQIDPTDVIEWPQQLCDKCGGSGTVGYVPAPQEPSPVG
jgi:DnaJ-class molecular chaperone